MFFLFAVLSISTAFLQAAQPPWIVKEEFISQNIPSFDCHSSSIVETRQNNLCAVWKGGHGEGWSNFGMDKVGIYAALFDGSIWTEPTEIVAADSVCWTPVLCKLSCQELLLFYRVGPSPRQTVSFVKKSTDGGKTWSEEEVLPAGIVGPTKNKPIVTSTGALICPSSCEVGAATERFKARACWIEIFENGQWKKVGPLEIPHRKFGAIEPTLFYDANGYLTLYCRDMANKIGEIGYIWTAHSADEGQTWSPLKPTPLPNPDSGIDVVDRGAGKLILLYNHSHTRRFPLNLAISSNGGISWGPPLVIESDSGEFPSGTLTSDGLLHVIYAHTVPGQMQRRIKHVVIDDRPLFQLYK